MDILNEPPPVRTFDHSPTLVCRDVENRLIRIATDGGRTREVHDQRRCKIVVNSMRLRITADLESFLELRNLFTIEVGRETGENIIRE